MDGEEILKFAQTMNPKELRDFIKTLQIPGFMPTYKTPAGQSWKPKTRLLEELETYLRTGALPESKIDDTDRYKPCEDTVKKLASGVSYVVKYKPQRVVKGLKWVCEEDREATDSLRNFVEYRKRKYAVDILRAIKQRYNISTFDEAAKKYDELKAAVKAGESGWATSVSTPALSRSYFLARNGKASHNVVTYEEMQKVLNDAGNTSVLGRNANFNKNVARRTYLTASMGWDKTRSKYTFMKDGQKKRVERNVIDRVRERLRSLHPAKKKPSEALAIEAIEQGSVGIYDVLRNEAIVGQKRIKGDQVAKFMNSIRNSNSTNSNSNTPVELAEYELDPVVLDDLVAQQFTDQMIEVARSMESSRAAADRALLAPYVASNGKMSQAQFARVIEKAMSTTGPLETRPSLFGNFGKSNELNVSMIEQIDKQMIRGLKSGCADEERQRRPWLVSRIPIGMSLTAAQAVVLAAATLRARNVLAPAPGMLAWHSLGSGKTLATVCVMVGFWNTDWCIVPVSVRTNSRSNSLDRLAAFAAEFFPTFRSTFEIPTDVEPRKALQYQYPFAFGKERALKNMRRRLQRGRELQYNTTAKLEDASLVGSFVTVVRDFLGSTERRTTVPYLNQSSNVKKTVFIVDEAHMLFSPPTSEKTFQKDYDNFRKLLTFRRSSSTYVVALTATPGESVGQVHSLLDMVAGTTLPKDTETMKRAVRDLGLISFAYLSADRSIFAKPFVSKECLPLDASVFAKYYLQQLSRLQETQNNVYNRFQAEFQEHRRPAARKASETQLKYDPGSKNAFWNRVRMLSEYIQVSQSSTLRNAYDVLNAEDVEDGFEAEMEAQSQASDFESLVVEGMKGRPLETGIVLARWRMTRDEYRYNVFVLSPKIIRCVNNILSRPGEIHFVYVNSWKTLRLVAFLLETLGYGRFTARDASTPGKRYGIINVSPVTPKREYCLGNDSWAQQRDTPSSTVTKLLGEKVAGEYRGGLLQQSKNARGQYCQIVLATGDNYKGVDVHHIRHVHCISMFADFVDLMQLQGRGPRNCSHRALEMSERTCIFHMYSLHNDSWPLKLQPDRYLLREAVMRAENLISLDEALQQSAVDFGVFGRWNPSRVELIEQLKGKECVVDPGPKPPRKKTIVKTNQNYVLQLYNAASRDWDKTRKERVRRAILRRTGQMPPLDFQPPQPVPKPTKPTKPANRPGTSRPSTSTNPADMKVEDLRQHMKETIPGYKVSVKGVYKPKPVMLQDLAEYLGTTPRQNTTAEHLDRPNNSQTLKRKFSNSENTLAKRPKL